MNVYIKALRAPFLTGSLIPVIIGAAYGFIDKHFSLLLFLITALGVAALHLAANLLNDYYDAKGSDPINVRLTPFSGGRARLHPGACCQSLCFFMCSVYLPLSGWFYWGDPLCLQSVF